MLNATFLRPPRPHIDACQDKTGSYININGQIRDGEATGLIPLCLYITPEKAKSIIKQRNYKTAVYNQRKRQAAYSFV